MSNWFRFYDDAVNDPKIIDLPDDLYRAWVNLLCIAAKNDGVLPEMKHIALVLRVKPAKAAAIIARLVGAELIDNHDGIFAPHNWQGRQFKSDDSGPRVKRHREKLRNAKRNGSGNVTVTEDGNAPEQAEKKAEEKQSRADAGAPVDEDLKKREAGLRAGVGAHFSAMGQPVPANMDRCLLWLTQGYAAGTVLGAVEAVLKRGKPILTLDYFDGAIKDRHAKIPPTVVPEIDRSGWAIVVGGTEEHTCWNIIRREQGQLPLFLCKQIAKDGTIYESAALCPTLFPPEFNDFGERIPVGEAAE